MQFVIALSRGTSFKIIPSFLLLNVTFLKLEPKFTISSHFSHKKLPLSRITAQYPHIYNSDTLQTSPKLQPSKNIMADQAGMLPQDRDVMDRANDLGTITQFNNPQDRILVDHDQRAMLHSKTFGNLPAQGLNTPTFGINNDNSTHFNIPAQGPYSAPCLPYQGGTIFSNMPTHDLNAIARGQSQGSPNLFPATYQDLMHSSQGPNQGGNDFFHTYFSDHIAFSEMARAASGHHPKGQGELNTTVHGDDHSTASHLSVSSQDQHSQCHGLNRMQNRGPNHGSDEQNSLVQQPNPGAQGQRQGIAHSFDGSANEPQTRSHDNNRDGRRSNHASPAQNAASRLLPGAQSPTSAAESNMIPRGRLNSVLNGLHTPVLAPPRYSNIQHSPPRRAFHSPITPDVTSGFTTATAEMSTTKAIPSSALASPSMPPMTRVSSNDRENLRHCAAREALIRQRLVMAEYLKKINLQCFKSSSDERVTLERDLAKGWGRSDANDNLQVLYAGELRLMEVNKLWDKYARGFRMCEEEIEELWGDLVVPDEESLPGEGAFQ